jgi:YegS/Rv2252/BmrU family lipid kinase
MKHIFIVNPAAGKGLINGGKKLFDLCNEIMNTCNTHNVDYEIKLSEYPGHATELAREYANKYNDCVIYSVGGDGTLNEVVNGIANTNATLGVIPNGSGNDFHRMLTNFNTEIIERTVDGSVDEVNYFKVNDKYGINIASIGYDAEVAYNIPKLKEMKIVPNSKLYLVSVLYTLSKYRGINAKITLNGTTFDKELTLLAICNGGYYGNGLHIATKANIYDDLLNICLVDKVNRARIPFLLGKLISEKHEDYPIVHTSYAQKIMVETSKKVACNIDGEIILTDNLEVALAPNKMKILKPRSTTMSELGGSFAKH